MIHPLLIALAVCVVVWLLLIVGLATFGQPQSAREVARFVPDCTVLFKRLLADPEVPRRNKIVLALVAAYLAMPIDLVPDFIPIAGQLDDALIVVLALRLTLRESGERALGRNWPGSPGALALIERAVGYSPRNT